MDKALIIGNLCTLFAMAFNSLSSTRKTPKGILLTQNMSQAVYGISAIVLGGYSAAVQNVVSILRNFTAIRSKKNKFVEWLLVTLGVVLGVAFNNRGWIGLLPVIGNLEYTLAVFRYRDNERALKVAFLINALMFTVFNAAIWNLVAVASNIVVIVTTIVFLWKNKR